MLRFTLALFLIPVVSLADTVVSTRIIRANSIIESDAITLSSSQVPGAIENPADILGMEARIAIYPGRAIRPGDIRPPALIERNQFVSLIYDRNGLSIRTEGRSLSRAAAGEIARVMNLASRKSVSGIVRADGAVQVSY